MVNLTINDLTIFQQILAADELSEELTVGADTMQHWQIKLDPENDNVIIDKKVTELRFVSWRFPK